MSRRPASRPPATPYRRSFELLFFILSMLGLLVVTHLWIQKGRGFDQGCWGFNPPAAGEAQVFDCEAVVSSTAGSVMGYSNILAGGMFYALVAGLTGLIALARNIGVLKLIRLAVVAVGVLYSAYLVNYQANYLGAFCALCLTSSGIVGILGVLALADRFMAAPASSPDFPERKGLVMRHFAPIAGIVAVLAIMDVVYFRNLETTTPAMAQNAPTAPASSMPMAGVDAECYYAEDAPVPNYAEFVYASDHVEGNPNAPVTVIEFFDPNCPHCATLYPEMKQLITTHGDSARFVIKPIYLWDFSRTQVMALMAAKEQGKFEPMLEAQFGAQKQGGLSNNELRQIASSIGMDADKMMDQIESGRYALTVERDRNKLFNTLPRVSVPRVWINGHTVAVRSADCMGQLISAAARQGTT